MSFSHRDINEVKQLAKEVATVCEEALMELRQSDASYVGYSNPKLSGKLRRRSMDLTRALAEMRKP